MSIAEGRAYFRELGLEDRVMEFNVSSATVDLAAAAVGVEGARIAKTLSFKTPEGCMLILAAGDAQAVVLLRERPVRGRLAVGLLQVDDAGIRAERLHPVPDDAVLRRVLKRFFLLLAAETVPLN